MRTDRLKFALHPKQTIRLPIGCEITGAHLENDISYLDLSLADGVPELKDITGTPHGFFGPGGVEVKTHDVTVLVFMEGETKEVETGDTVKMEELEGGKVYTAQPIPIPEPSDKLRKLASFETQECIATWHVFIES